MNGWLLFVWFEKGSHNWRKRAAQIRPKINNNNSFLKYTLFQALNYPKARGIEIKSICIPLAKRHGFPCLFGSRQYWRIFVSFPSTSLNRFAYLSSGYILNGKHIKSVHVYIQNSLLVVNAIRTKNAIHAPTKYRNLFIINIHI